jgi:predicted GNAT family acetyltransferase
MHLPPERFRPLESDHTIRLNSSHLDVVKELYGESTPEFFLASMLDEGIYYGLGENGRLDAIAGTHVFSLNHKIGALGNIFTRPDKRNRRYSSITTSAAAISLLQAGIETIVLNVMEENTAAMKVYKRLGFDPYGRFLEMTVISE